MRLSEFTIHDVTQFPVVRCVPERVYPGYGCQWRNELEALIDHNEPFFMVFDSGTFDEAAEDTRIRALWLKENRVCLSKVCRSIVSIEPNEQRRCKLAAQCPGLAKAFGIPRMVAGNDHEALSLGLGALS